MFLLFLVTSGALFLTYEFARAIRHGRIGYGRNARLRDDQPFEFWGQTAYALVFALALLVSAAWIWRTGSPPRFPFLHLLLCGWFTLLFARAFAAGCMTIGAVSFLRTDEPREFWLLFGGGSVVLLFIWIGTLAIALSD